MRKPHFMQARGRKTPATASPPADHAAAGSPTEIVENCPVIHADRVILGSSIPSRLRVVCFENPYADLGGFLAGQ